MKNKFILVLLLVFLLPSISSLVIDDGTDGVILNTSAGSQLVWDTNITADNVSISSTEITLNNADCVVGSIIDSLIFWDNSNESKLASTFCQIAAALTNTICDDSLSDLATAMVLFGMIMTIVLIGGVITLFVLMSRGMIESNPFESSTGDSTGKIVMGIIIVSIAALVLITVMVALESGVCSV